MKHKKGHTLLLLLIQWQVTNEEIVSNLIANSTRSPWKPEEREYSQYSLITMET